MVFFICNSGGYMLGISCSKLGLLSVSKSSMYLTVCKKKEEKISCVIEFT